MIRFSETPPPAAQDLPPMTTAERIAEAMVTLHHTVCGVTAEHLISAGFTAEEIATHGAEAARIARQRFWNEEVEL